MDISSVLVADSSQTSIIQIKDILIKRGYRVYQASDGSAALRIARGIRPHLVLMDVNLWGTDVFETGRLIESEKLSTIVFMTAKPSREFLDKIGPMKVYAYITKPINPVQLIQIVEFSLINSNRIKTLEERVEKLESSLSARKTIDRAKGILMDTLGIPEQDAYNRLRKMSMDEGKSMEWVAKGVIKKYDD